MLSVVPEPVTPLADAPAVFDLLERERRRLGQGLHDSICQTLTGITFRARLLARQLRAGSAPGDPARAVDELGELLLEAAEQVRDLAAGCDPERLVAWGLPAALERLVAAVAPVVPARLECPDPLPGLPEPVVLHLCRIAEEAVGNAVQHAGAGEITVMCAPLPGGRLTLVVADDGRGFDPAQVEGPALGLALMRRRAAELGATFSFQAAPGRGCRVVCTLPPP